MDIPYSIEHKRDLNDTELNIIRYLLNNSGLKNYLSGVSNLKVIARCGCGNCPTVLFGNSFDAKPIQSAGVLTAFWGTDCNGTKIGVNLLGTESQLTELEAWSVCGDDIESWPEINTLTKIAT